MRITRVYTRTGDQGITGLAGGQRVSKDHPRIEACGTVDELNAIVGLARAFIKDLLETVPQAERLDAELHRIQNRLFDVGGILATQPGQRFKNMPRIAASEVRRLERLMDESQKELRPLEEFILPGGGRAAGFLHQARTVCRRAERICVRLSREEGIPPVILRYLNRLSDAFFVLARWIARAEGEPEIYWKRSVKLSMD